MKLLEVGTFNTLPNIFFDKLEYAFKLDYSALVLLQMNHTVLIFFHPRFEDISSVKRLLEDMTKVEIASNWR